MPFKSDAQKRFMWARHPDIARKWTEEGKGKVDNQFKPKSGTTVSNNAPVGTAGNPALTDASSKGQRGNMTKGKSGAIERRIKNLQKGKK